MYNYLDDHPVSSSPSHTDAQQGGRHQRQPSAMDLLSESIKGRLLLAIPKKGDGVTGTIGTVADERVGRLHERCLQLLAGEYHYFALYERNS